ncbi:MAG: segregation/condensation protein A [Myxococcota bacterium]
MSVDPAQPKAYDRRPVSQSDPEGGAPSSSAPPRPAKDGPRPREVAAAPPPESPGAQPSLPNVDTAPTGRAHPPPPAPPEPDPDAEADVYRVVIDGFDGPLDLLLHLIRKHELDILDIPVGFITEKYLEYMSAMESLHIDVASEYLVMAATLTLIKSKMLLPPDPTAEDPEVDDEAEEVDPRAELVRQLLEYQKYRHAAAQLELRATLGRDAFPRGDEEPLPEGEAPLAPLSAFKLFDAFERVLKRAARVTDHQVMFERVSIADRIIALTELLTKRRRLPFEALFEAVGADGDDDEDEDDPAARLPPTRIDMVITFLAILEMGKMRVVRIMQEDSLGPILVELPAKTLDRRDDIPAAHADADTTTAAPAAAATTTTAAAASSEATRRTETDEAR